LDTSGRFNNTPNQTKPELHRPNTIFTNIFRSAPSTHKNQLLPAPSPVIITLLPLLSITASAQERT
ncbi:MAG: hypothetical protein NC429_09640, partial [Lachnospiraceae bacterium]|nr:hypothetical protein [Lachnospiraceae bacterium]